LIGEPIAGYGIHHHFNIAVGRRPPRVDEDAMIGLFLRFVGLWLIAGALVALVIDATKSIASSALTVTQLGPTWYALSPSTLLAAQRFVERQIEAYVGNWLWDPLILWVLMLPTWAVLAALGFLLAYLGRRRRRRRAFA
jgi:hypothetical protein